MVVINSIGGIPEPVPEKPSRIKSEKDTDVREAKGVIRSPAQQEDQVIISSEAQAAAEIARLVRLIRSQEEIRTDKVEQARQRLESGEYKKPEIVEKVAEKIMRLIK
ncbi:MAG: flagellar biosynthesis anti-sigma factor FlgM [Candidatus Hydrogenedentes bacterium]|nr:flagellar biosynthesis anti-sigma factor FlgM [Candidatus Hydrogenedentota bacterium]